MSTQTTFCAIPLPGVVYAGPKTRAEFDALPLPETVHDWVGSDTTTLLKADGRRWERRCHVKAVEGQGVRVIFQWFDERPVAGQEEPAAIQKGVDALPPSEHATLSRQPTDLAAFSRALSACDEAGICRSLGIAT